MPYALGIALLLHVLATPILYQMFKPLPPPKKVTKVRMVPMTGNGQIARPNMTRPNELTQREKSERKREEEKKKEAEKKIDETLKDKQIVDVPPSPDNKVPDNAKYLSEHNTNTEKETVSRHQNKDYSTAMNEPTVARKSDGLSSPQLGGDPNVLEVAPDIAKADQKKDQKKQDKKQAQAPQLEFPKIAAADKLALALDPRMGTLLNRDETEEVAGNGSKLRIAPGQEGATEQSQQQAGRAPKAGKPAADLMPTMGTLSRIAGSPASDYLNEQEGEGTFLNTREFKYAGFFNRVKKGVSQRWNPIAEYQRRDPTGHVYGQIARTTTLSITLLPNGNLKDAVIVRSSGLPFLDEEAIAAFKRAQPFPNPPPQLVDGTGGITFNFGFVLDFRDGGMRLPF
ncbi:MAG: TonB family protein [Clostridia bacterium]|nr:TonB family protein [Deltaproteobacteria bacterium]